MDAFVFADRWQLFLSRQSIVSMQGVTALLKHQTESESTGSLAFMVPTVEFSVWSDIFSRSANEVVRRIQSCCSEDRRGELVSLTHVSVKPWCWSLLIAVMFEDWSSSLRCLDGRYRPAASRSKRSLWTWKRKVCSWCCTASFWKLHCIDISKHLVPLSPSSMDSPSRHIGRALPLATVCGSTLGFWK